jgi:hypothetical protein
MDSVRPLSSLTGVTGATRLSLPHRQDNPWPFTPGGTPRSHG